MAVKPDHRDTGRPKAARPQRPSYASTRAYTSDESIAAVESGYGAHAASSRHIGSMTPKALDSMSPQELYSLLQHSPTLDSNVERVRRTRSERRGRTGTLTETNGPRRKKFSRRAV